MFFLEFAPIPNRRRSIFAFIYWEWSSFGKSGALFLSLSNKRFSSESHSIRTNRLQGTHILVNFRAVALLAERGRLRRRMTYALYCRKHSVESKQSFPNNTESQSNDNLTWANQLHSNEVTTFTLRPTPSTWPQVSDFVHSAAIHVRVTGTHNAARRWTTTSFGMSRKSQALASMRMTRSVEVWWHCLQQFKPIAIGRFRDS